MLTLIKREEDFTYDDPLEKMIKKKNINRTLNNDNQFWKKQGLYSYNDFKDIVTSIVKDEKAPKICNPDVFKVFQIQGPRITRSRVRIQGEKTLCDIQSTCCTNHHFDSTYTKMASVVKKLRRRYQPYMDLFDLFEEGSVIQYIQNNVNNKDCIGILREDVDKNEQDEHTEAEYLDLTDTDNYLQFIDLVDKLRENIQNYLNQTEKFYAGIICMTCDPNVSKYFNFDGKYLKIDVNYDVCKLQLSQYRFFYDFQLLYTRFFSRVVDFISCTEKTITQDSFPDMMFMVGNFDIDYTLCPTEFDPKNMKCLDQCQKVFSLHEVSQYFQIGIYIKKMVDILMKHLIQIDVEAHYRDNLNQEYWLGLEQRPITLFAEFSMFGQNYSLETVEVKFHSGKGINPFKRTFKLYFQEKIEKLIQQQSKQIIQLQMNLKFIFLFFILSIKTEKPKMRWVHGLGSNCYLEDLTFKTHFKDYDAECIGTGMGFVKSFEHQIQSACDQLNKQIDQLKSGFTLIGISQGGLIARAVLQRCEVGKYVKRLITIGGPHQGVAVIPNIDIHSSVNTIIRACFFSLIQGIVGPCGYMRNMNYKEDYLNSKNSILDLNNEKNFNQQYYDRVNQLDLFMAIGFQDDTMIQPKNTSVFGSFKDSEFSSYSGMEEQDVFVKDRLPLKRLLESQKLFRCVIPGQHLQLGEEFTKKLVVDFSNTETDEYKKNLDDIRKVCLFN